MSALHDQLEADGPHTAPEPMTAEELSTRPRRPSPILGLLISAAALAGTLRAADELGVVDVPHEGSLGLAFLSLVTIGLVAEAALLLTQRGLDDDE